MNKAITRTRPVWAYGWLCLLATLCLPAAQAQQSAEELIDTRCIACHAKSDDADHPWSRISHQRKSPEGWALTLRRMQAIRGAYLTPEENQILVKYLADHQGLAPEEAADYRYVLERRPNVVEQTDEVTTQMCARCHSAARFSLQGRPQTEWEHLVHFHMGQFPTIELQAMSRDRPWFKIAIEQVAPYLADKFPLESQAWEQWKNAPKPDLSGSWRLSGYLPEKGDYAATLTATKTGDDRYDLSLAGSFDTGEALEGSGQALVYTGYEWRAELSVNGEDLRQVLAASKDGAAMSGRLYFSDNDEIGGPLQAVKEGGAPAILDVRPSYLKAGASVELTIIGTGLDGDVSLGEGVTVDQVVSRDSGKVIVQASAASDAASGKRAVQVGDGVAEDTFAVYDRLARVEVYPNESISRVGGNGGPLPKVKATYRAIGYAAGADGQPGTEDDLRLGFMPATWSVKPFNEVAEHDNDVKYAGMMDAETGVFTPADAGPNPERAMSTNNLGNLAVVATVSDGDQQVSGEGHLLATIQTFITLQVQ